MSDVIEWVLEMRVQDGQADAVQPLIDEMVAATKADEQGALHYEYYMTPDRSTCTVLERYADNAAVMAHLGNFGAKFAERFMTVFTPERFNVYGPANDEVRAALAGFGANHLEQAAGFHR
ncbi:Antibiotic biosynthesis monooxygenase [Sulfitobacter brevis]|uniref:Antibiotic biosynthesis monooxygenase n=1 Tax=Sulfitobacter brevis TaxID=74348 RepID=A0A1I1YL57_9RHOB|nr:antibiotic biosynthesis monooxygenase [Sulfitobacter brevis]SFE20247.1 Antibiotic biosynthesis monooxygenase [Sulfitobacter brevis]